MENETKEIYNRTVDCSAKFIKNEGRFTSSMQLFIGKIVVASYFYNGSASKGDPKKYKVSSPFVQLKDQFKNFATEQECEEMCLKVAKLFCDKLENK